MQLETKHVTNHPGGLVERRLSGAIDHTIPGDDHPYWQSYVVFIVRDDRPADILFQCSDNTWQAYNRWPLLGSPGVNEGQTASLIFWKCQCRRREEADKALPRHLQL